MYIVIQNTSSLYFSDGHFFPTKILTIVEMHS